jgi:hypothetical protein
MNKIAQILFKDKVMILASMAFALSGCPLNVNLNVATDKPIALVIDKPLDVKLDAGVAIKELAPIKVTTLAPVKVGIAEKKPKD